MAMPGRRSEKKPDDLKSKAYHFRLHPEIPKEATARQIIDYYTTDDYGLRQLIVDALHIYAGLEAPGAEPIVKQSDLDLIKSMLEQIAEHIQDIDTSAAPSRGSKQKPSSGGGKINLSNNFLSSLSRMLDEGITADEYEGDDE